MLLLVSGASGAERPLPACTPEKLLDDSFEDVEFYTLGPIPTELSMAWRHQQAEVAVRLAINLDRPGRHLLFAGDPVPAGEVLAAPSANQIDIAVCLLDADADAQSARLDARQDPPEGRDRHLAYAEWLHRHVVDPDHLPEAITSDGWSQMRWDRWVTREPGPEWAMTVIDTSDLTPKLVGVAVAGWCRAAVAGTVPVFRVGWHNQ
jgi:hypothetical protein